MLYNTHNLCHLFELLYLAGLAYCINASCRAFLKIRYKDFITALEIPVPTVTLIQAELNFDLKRDYNSTMGDEYDLFHGRNVNSIGPNGISPGSSYPNTKAYQNGNIINAGVTISNIGDAGYTMTFDITIPPVTSCVDSLLRFKLFKNRLRITRGYNWVKNKFTESCYPLNGVSAMCPDTCNTCSDCVDCPLFPDEDTNSIRFKLWKDGKYIWRCCDWVRSRGVSS